MTTTTKFPNGISFGREGGTTDVSGVMAVARASFDATSATQIELFTLPAGAIVVDVLSYGGGTGGANPTVDIGTSGDDDALANELAVDKTESAVSGGTGGTSLNTLFSAPQTIYGKVGASAATGGNAVVSVLYIVTDV